MAERNAIAVLIKLLGGEAMTEELKKLGETGEKAMEQIQDAAKKVEFGGLGNDLSILIGDIGTFAKRSVVALGLLKVAADGVGAALLLLAKSGAEAADEAGKAAQAAGLSAKAYQEWAFAAEGVGVTQKQVSTAFDTFNKQVIKTADETVKASGKLKGAGASVRQFGQDTKQANADITQGAGYTVQAFKDIGVEVTRFGAAASKVKAGTAQAKTGFDELGIKVKNSNGTLKTNEQLLIEVANAFQKMPDGARKSQIALKLFGEAGAKLIPLLDQGAAGIDEFKKKAAELGIVFTDEQIKQAAKFNDALNELKQAAGGVLRQLGLILVPSFTAGFNAFRDIILRNKAAILDFANNALARAKVLVADYFAALSGRDADVNNKWIIEWRDAIVGFGQDALHVINGVVLPAFKLLREGAGLVTDSINKMFGTNVSGGELLILASITQVLGGFRLIKDAIFVAINAISLFSTALVANPWLLAITAVAAGIVIWATRTDEATAALQQHEKVVNEVDAAYQKVGGSLAKMTQEVKDRLLLEASDSLDKTKQALVDALGDLSNKLPHFEGDLQNSAAQALFGLAKQLQEGTISVEKFNEEVARIGAVNVGNDVGKLAQTWLEMSKQATELSAKTGEMADKVAWLSGKMNDQDFAAKEAARGIQGYVSATKDAASDTDAFGKSADETAKKVDGLSHSINVFRGGGTGGQISKEVFDVIDGVAHRADQSKQALDGVAASAQSAGDHIRTVSKEVSDSVGEVQKLKPAVDEAASGLKEALTQDNGVGAGLGAGIETTVNKVITEVQKMPPAAGDSVSGLKDALDQSDAGGGLSADISQAVDGVITDLDRMPPAAQAAATATADPFRQLPTLFSGIFSGLGTLVQGGFGNLLSTIRSLAGQIQSEISAIISQLQAAVAQAQQLRAQAGASGGGGSQGGFASGGHVVGPGTATSDSILAWLSNGEFVMQAAAVRRLGVGFLTALNNGFIPSLKSLKGFSMGGLAERVSQSLAIPRFAGGGFAVAVPASAGSLATEGRTPFSLVLPGGEVIDDMTIGDIGLRRLQNASLRGARVSAGRAPRRGS